MFDLDITHTLLLISCLGAVCLFEFVNGFHDTANAVATVIYTHTLKPWIAVIWSGSWNFLGVMLGGIGVAMSIVNLLPSQTLIDQDVSHSISVCASILITAISWNLLTWYLGIPCSSSHTLIGSILGVGLAYSFLPDATIDAVNWGKAKEIGLSLLFSPLFGFTVTIILMYILRTSTKNTKTGGTLFKEPKTKQPPPLWIRIILFLTCTLVSFFHGQNDGQKGVGLAMLILISIVPSYFAINSHLNMAYVPSSVHSTEQVITAIDTTMLSKSSKNKLAESKLCLAKLETDFSRIDQEGSVDKLKKSEIRKNILLLDKNMELLLEKEDLKMSKIDQQKLQIELQKIKKLTDFAPTWVVLMISISLGLGTTIGWKRIVKTVGEKIGKEHLSYAQGASAEMVASITIGLSTAFHWPVSTTHVLSSGIAGSMVATKGVKNLQPNTVRNIILAWVLTLPVVMIMSGGLFIIFKLVI